MLQLKPSLSSKTKIRISEYINDFTGFSYYEYKFFVSQEQLGHVKQVLDVFSGGTDPFPSGIVDSIYYDTPDGKIFFECLNGDAKKCKFRIRGYGDGRYLQIHQKVKDLSSVSKYKCSLNPATAPREIAPEWNELLPKVPYHQDFEKIFYNSRKYGPMIPSVRVKYFRYRYRAYDYRITLDTNIEVFAPQNGIPRKLNYAMLPRHVLEIKTTDVRPKLPFIGLIQLPQISFSKFMLGLIMLKD
jgi:hypothetical protein